MSARDPHCPLCQEDGGTLLWRGPHLRIIEVEDPDYPGFTRVIWNAHLAEMTSLSTHGRDLLMRAVYVVEETQQAVETLAGFLKTSRMTVLLVEHDMEVVFRLAQRITVLHRGAVIADGAPAEVKADPAVQEAYLGGFE